MGTGIIVCGLNGTGKSTLGKALEEKLHFYFIDNEDFFVFSSIKGDDGETIVPWKPLFPLWQNRRA